MAIDITKTDNYIQLSGSEKLLAAAAVTAIKAAYADTTDAKKDNMYMILKEQNESQEET